MTTPLNKHFLIAETAQNLPDGWRATEIAGWWIGRGQDLRLYPICGSDDEPVGAVLGWVLGSDGLLPDGTPLPAPAPEAHLADWSADFAGRFVCLVGQGRLARFFLDAGGLLGAVYDPARRAIASIPDLLPGGATRDEALVAHFKIPERHGWYPFGLTPALGVLRLLPSFSLALDDFVPTRFWPIGPTAIVERTPAESIPEIHAIAADIAQRFCRGGKVAMHLTAGYDSRMVLAALGPASAKVPVITISLPSPGAALDVRIAARLAARFGLHNEVRPYVPALPADIAEWHARTGDCISDGVSELSRTLASWDVEELQIGGACGEVARAFYWTSADLAAQPPGPEELLRRLNIPQTHQTQIAAEGWLATLPPVSTARMWDLAYIEQRLGCWAGPAVYGSPQRAPSMSPFNTRRLYAAILGLPDAYRASNRFYRDFIDAGWPELNSLPYNTPVGLDRLRFLKSQAKALLPNSLRHKIKRLIGR